MRISVPREKKLFGCLVESSIPQGQREWRLVGIGSVVPAHTAAGWIGRPVSCVLKRSSCRSIMLRQKELAFIKAISTLQLSPALLRELRMALSRRKKKPVVPVGRARTTSGSAARASQRPSSQLAGKRKAKRAGKLGRFV